MLPKRLTAQLGLRQVRSRQARGLGGPVMLPIYSAVRLTIQGPECVLDVAEVPDDLPVLIGQVALELLDWAVDPKAQRLLGNPAHGGEQVIELF